MGGVATHVLFDSGATHCFVRPEMIGIGEFQKEPEGEVALVRAAGGQVMYTVGKIRNISVMIGEVDMPADLLVFPVKMYDVILRMDWLSKYKVHLDCHRGRVQLETSSGKQVYQGVRPTKGSLVISALQAERMLKKDARPIWLKSRLWKSVLMPIWKEFRS